MGLIVQKFGGSSVANADRLRNVADIIVETCRAGHQVVAVLSAQGDTTDDLIEKAGELTALPSGREMDALLSTGEQVSCALCAMAIGELDCPVVSLTGWQAGIQTDDTYGDARIQQVDTSRIEEELARGAVVLVTGFQGLSPQGDITTLGRGGSDTSAVALAAALKADRCQIYTDVEGVYTIDPRLVPAAQKLDEISYDEMLELARQGAQVLHDRSVELAERSGVELEVLSSFTRHPGTIVKRVPEPRGRAAGRLCGIAIRRDLTRLTLWGRMGAAHLTDQVAECLAENGVQSEEALQVIGDGDQKELSFTIPKGTEEWAFRCLKEQQEKLGLIEVKIDDGDSKLSLIGEGIGDTPEVARALFLALGEAEIEHHLLGSTPCRLSVLVARDRLEEAAELVHARFFCTREE